MAAHDGFGIQIDTRAPGTNVVFDRTNDGAGMTPHSESPAMPRSELPQTRAVPPRVNHSCRSRVSGAHLRAFELQPRIDTNRREWEAAFPVFIDAHSRPFAVEPPLGWFINTAGPEVR